MLVAAVEVTRLLQLRLLIFFARGFASFSDGSFTECHKNVTYSSPLADQCCTHLLKASRWALKVLKCAGLAYC